MSAIIVPHQRLRQPLLPVSINRSSSLAHGLKIVCDPGVDFKDRAGIANVTTSGTLTRVVGKHGLSIQGSASSYVDMGARFNAFVAITVLQVINPGSLVNTFSYSNGSDGHEYLIGGASVAGTVHFRLGSVSYGTLTGLNDNQDHVVVTRYIPSTSVEMWCDTLSRKSTTTSGIPSSTGGSSNLRLHNRGSTFYTGKSGLYALWFRGLNDAEIAGVLANPRRTLEDEREIIWIGSASDPGPGTHYTLSATSTAFNTTGQDAVLRAHRKLAATPQSMALTTYSAALRAHRKLVTSTQSYSLTGQDAVLRARRKILASPQSYSLTPASANLARRYRLSTTAGSYLTAGQDAVLRAHRKLVTSTAAFHMTARTANLVYSAAPVVESDGSLYPWLRRRRR